MRNWRYSMGIVAAFMLLLALAACGSEEESSDKVSNDTSASENQSEQANESDGTYPLTVSPTIASTESDEIGTVIYDDVTFDEMPKKIVVFDYGFLDTLHTLGVEGIVGVAKESTLPGHLSEYESDEYGNIGTLKAPLFEDIAEMEPDVIFISGRQSTYYEELQEIAPVVFIGTAQ